MDKGDGKVLIKISDTGSGMTEEFIHTHLFVPFESTKGLTGMGIGVYQSREYIRKAGGDLVAKSTPGEGSEFTISLVEESVKENTDAQ